MRSYTLLLLFLGIRVLGAAQAPSWIDPIQREAQYPASKYVTGFASGLIGRNDDPEKLTQGLLMEAKKQVAENLRTTIRSSVLYQVEVKNTKSNEQFLQASASFSEATVSGLKTQSFADKKKKTVYAIAYVTREELLAGCRTGFSRNYSAVLESIAAAKKYQSARQTDLALNAYSQCYSKIRELENDYSIITALGQEPPQQSIKDLETQVSQGVSDLREKNPNSLDDVCTLIAYSINDVFRPDMPRDVIRQGSITYQNTGIASEFSDRLASLLQQKLSEKKFVVQTDTGRDATAGSRSLVLTGTYWDEKENLKLIIWLKEPGSGKIAASTEERLLTAWLRDHSIEYVPENLANALALQKELARNQIVGGGLVADLWTNKGRDNPLYKEDEEMKVYIKVNRPCYVRLIYYMADGSKSPLLDNLFIDEEKVNKAYIIPQTWQAAAPFGQETMQLVAQTQPFKPLNTKIVDGYTLIDESAKDVIANVRGMKPKTDEQFNAEKIMSVTTIAK
jgi:hypothetical protein